MLFVLLSEGASGLEYFFSQRELHFISTKIQKFILGADLPLENNVYASIVLALYFQSDLSTKKIAAGRRGRCSGKLVLNVREQEAG